ncbi:Tubulin epsilon chain [Allomyces arbusculus]|nr:Tubulin epsilon chain [Allomyces arbusculus]
MATFFQNIERRGKRRASVPVGDGTGQIKGLEARGLMIDMEEGVINAMDGSPLRELFTPDQILTATSGSGNNWAVGHHHYGAQYGDQLRDMIRKQAEACDALQSVFLIHSLGGGTGSGLGTRIAALLADELPDVYRFATVVAPSPQHDDVVTSPYNAVLALRHLAEHADAVVPVENQALMDICAHAGVSDPKADAKPFGAMNQIVAQLMLNMTASMRFPGSLNVDINEITMNLVPFPALKYLLASMSPVAVRPAAGAPAASVRVDRRVDQMFTEAFQPEAQLIKCNPRTSVYVACAAMARGALQVSDLRRNIDRIQKQLQFVWWNQEGWKTGLCHVPPATTSESLLTLSNNTCIAQSFAGIKTRFMKLYTRKANLHHYIEYMEKAEFTDALASLNSVIAEYRQVERDPGPQDVEGDDWEAWARAQVRGRVGAGMDGV